MSLLCLELCSAPLSSTAVFCLPITDSCAFAHTSIACLCLLLPSSAALDETEGSSDRTPSCPLAIYDQDSPTHIFFLSLCPLQTSFCLVQTFLCLVRTFFYLIRTFFCRVQSLFYLVQTFSSPPIFAVLQCVLRLSLTVFLSFSITTRPMCMTMSYPPPRHVHYPPKEPTPFCASEPEKGAELREEARVCSRLVRREMKRRSREKGYRFA